MKPTKSNGKRKRGSRGAGRLYKRDASGKEHPADWNGSGAYWLAYIIPNPNGGKGRRIREPLKDDAGNAITDRVQAERERLRKVRPYQTQNEAETLRVIQSRINDAEERHIQAVDKANPPLTIQEAWTAYVRAPERPDSGPVTLSNYEGYWNRFLAWSAETHSDVEYLRDVTAAMAADYAANLTGAGKSPNAFNKHTGFLRLAFRVLSDQARITANPFAKIKRKKQLPHSRRELTLSELTTILDRAEGDLSLLLYLGACTGLRLGDCSTLQWGDVDLARGIIRRIPNKTARSGKPVVVGIPPALHERLATTPAKKRTGYVLPEYADRYGRESSLVTNRVQAHILDCGIDTAAPGTGQRIKRDADGTPERDGQGKVITEADPSGKHAVVDVGFHSLRHTWVSMHAAAGTPGAIVQASVGHSNPAMTAHYTHVNEITARDVSRALPAFAGNGEPAREPLPPWAVELIEKLPKSKIKAELLKGGAE